MNAKKMMSLVFGAIGLTAVITGILTAMVDSRIDRLNDAARVRYLSYQLADELRQSSDDLTRLARTYAITGDEKYERMYLDILAIRNGEKPRPENYHQIYWDLVLNYGEKPKPDGKLQAIKSMMKELGFSDEEFGYLDEAQRNSDALVGLEVRAMNAVKGLFIDPNSKNYTVQGEPDMALARELLHSNQYHAEKAKIMAPIDKFFTALDRRTGVEFESQLSNLHAALIWAQSALVLMILVALGGFYLVKSNIVSPLVKTCRQLGSIQKAKDLSQRISVNAQGEIAEIEAQINSFITSLSGSLQSTDAIAREVAELTNQTRTAVRQSRENTDSVAHELDTSASAMEEMTATLSHVSENTQDAESRAAENETHVTLGQETVHQAMKAMDILESEFSNTQNAMQHLVNESSQVSNVLGVIKAIAEQTNLLALNAAIEAARAGEQGRGFAVVADEVRSLAQRTQDSTKEIDDIVASLQSRTSQVSGSVTQAAGMMQKAGDELKRIVSVFEDIRQSTAAIHGVNTQVATSTEEQSLVSRDIANSLMVIRDSSMTVKQIIDTLETTCSELDGKANKLREQAAEYRY
ncbi:methyl-accepting chemotaxis protein [Shewanella sp. 3B26]|uniref:Methyl-accepting chemotaxis protein n=1 Tax=Shewanella zhuhaiensis TaxID=2919576 RepID=A0AAJ1BHN2_9GAMM|nr:methyl-accepting chemotaxis protein [Shewanella zhuhaiensis]MCH4294014.1 methyl-accepting chemotaxis protein [Shewanella zhuhaiensis]